MSLQQVFSNKELKPWAELAPELSVRFLANLQLAEGTIVGQITSADQNATQTITFGGTPNGGSFILDFNGRRTAPISYNVSGATQATNIRTALAALSNVNGTANVNVTGTGPWTVTWQGALASNPQPLLVVVANNLTGTAPTITVAEGNVGRKQGAYCAYDGTVLAPPSAPTVSEQAAGSLPLLSQFACQVTYVTAAGETLPSAPKLLALTSTNRTVRFSQISSVPASVTHGRFYLNGIRYAETAVSGGNIPQTDITAEPASANAIPTVSTGFTNVDGRAVALGILKYPIRTDEQARVVFGDELKTELGLSYTGSAPIFRGGVFRRGDLAGFDANALTQLGARILRGTSISDNEALIQVPA